MNANELADRLDKISYDCTIEEWRASPVGEAATKLRQQQESIEGLNRDYDLLFAEHQLLLKKEWLEPESSDVEIAAEQSDNYAAFHAGVKFARAYPSQPKEQKYHRGDRLICLETEEYCVIHISGTDRQWVEFPDSHIGVYTNGQVAELFELSQEVKHDTR